MMDTIRLIYEKYFLFVLTFLTNHPQFVDNNTNICVFLSDFTGYFVTNREKYCPDKTLFYY